MQSNIKSKNLNVCAILALSGVLTACTGPMMQMVIPTLSSMPEDSQRRGEYLESTRARRGAEGLGRMPTRLKKLESAAATVAAVVGALASTSTNATVGIGGTFDENRLFRTAREAQTKKRKLEHDNEAHRTVPLLLCVDLRADSC